VPFGSLAFVPRRPEFLSLYHTRRFNAMAYKPESYSEVLRWLEDTEIEYVPHGKKAGTKSYDRYEKYSQAKTVAAALEFGSKPLDLVHDFEKRLLKRVAGPVRDEPLNLIAVEDTTTLTKTDLIIGAFAYQLAKREKGGEAGDDKDPEKVRQALRKAKLSAKFGVKVEDMAAGVGWAESPSMVASRSRANVEATKILEEAAAEGRKITSEEVLRVLRLWAVKRNGDRKNVMPEGMTWVHSETIGLLHCSGGRLIATLHTRAYPKVLTLFCQWLKDDQENGPAKDFQFTSIIVNSAYSAKRHRDHLNVGPSCIRAFGNFQGGNLKYWPEDDKKTNLESLREEDAEVLDVQNTTAFMDGNRAHEVEAFTGDERFSLVFFTAGHYQKTADDVREQLVQVGIPFPDDDAVARTRALLPAPRGYGIGADEMKDSTKKVGNKGKKMLLKKEEGQRKKPLFATGFLFNKVMAAKRAKESEAASSKSGTLPTKASGTVPKRLVGLFALKAGGSASAPLKRKAEDAVENREEKKPAGAKLRRPLMIGGLLGKIQAKQQQQQLRRQDSPEPSSPSENSTPQPKRARIEAAGAAAGTSLGLSSSGEKTRLAKKEPRAAAHTSKASSTESAGASKLSRSLHTSKASGPKAAAAATMNSESAEEGDTTAPVAAAALGGGGSNFLAFAMSISSAANYEGAAAVTELAKALKALTCSSRDPEASIRHALTVLAPASPAVPRVLTAAIAEAFGEPAIPGLSGEALAAKAFTDQQRKRGSRQGQPLTLEEVATTMAACCGGLDEASKVTEQRLAQLLGRAQSEGMEVYFLVRALQGKVGPSQEVVYGTMARMITCA